MRADEFGGGKEISGELIVAGGDASPILDAAEEILNLVPTSVRALGIIGFFDGIAAIGDARQGSFILDLLSHFLAGDLRPCLSLKLLVYSLLYTPEGNVT